MKRRVIILVSGLAQGVFYRSSTQKKSKELNLVGWVKNEADGRVKIVAEGEKENLEKLIKWTKSGPPLARIHKIEVKWDKDQKELKNFEIVY